MLPRIAIMWLSFALFSAGLAAEIDQPGIEGYSTDPVHEAIFDPATVLVRAVRFNNWLNDNAATLSGEKKKQTREHLYYLINSQIKHRYADNKNLFPTEGDAILSMLFSWSVRLGVYGGHLINNQIKIANWEAQEPTNIFPDDWSLSLNDGLFTLASDKSNWAASYPYYFMLADAQSFDNTAGMPTNFVSFSTGSAHHADGKGYSQATLIFIHSPETKLPAFKEYWLEAFAMPEKSTKSIDARQNKNSNYFFDKKSRLHKEIVSWQEPQGAFAIAYLGIDGTYQHNRQHFLDFLASLKTGHSSTGPYPHDAKPGGPDR